MSTFLYVYHGGSKPESEEAINEAMEAWGAWLGGLGDKAADPGNPVGMSSTVHPDGSVTADGGSNPAGGYSIIEAADMEEALTHAKGCPILKDGGSVEVAEIFHIDM